MPRAPATGIALFVLLGAVIHFPAAADEPGITADPQEVFRLEVRALFEELDLYGMRRLCEERLSEPGNAVDTLSTIYLYQGMVFALEARPGQAVEFFKRFLAIAPDGKLPEDAGPHIAEPFAKAAAFWASHDRFELDHDPPAGLPESGTLVLRVRVKGDALGLADSIALRIRATGSESWSRLTVPGSATKVTFDVTALSPGDEELPEVVEYFLQVLDPFGGTVLTDGSEDTPHRLFVPLGVGSLLPKERKDGKRAPWAALGVGIGLGVAAAAAAVVVVGIVGRRTTGPIDIVFRVADP